MKALFIEDRDMLGCPFCSKVLGEIELRNNLLSDTEFYWIVNTEEQSGNLNDLAVNIVEEILKERRIPTPMIIDGNIFITNMWSESNISGYLRGLNER